VWKIEDKNGNIFIDMSKRTWPAHAAAMLDGFPVVAAMTTPS